MHKDLQEKQTGEKPVSEVYMIKYKVYINGKKTQVSYSQFCDTFLNVQDGVNIDTKIQQDLRFYKNSLPIQEAKECHIDILVNNQEYKTVTLR